MKITEEMIPLIEKALGFKLYDWQRAYLLEEQHSKPKERASGRTTAYIVKLLLTNHEPIDIKFHAMRYKDHQGVHYTDFFRNFMREIDEKLTNVGLPTCTVKPKSNNRTIEIEIDADTSKLQLKLRAIAKYVGALADELDAIDNVWQCDCGSLDYSDHTYPSGSLVTRVCDKCKESCIVPNDNELPTQLKGTTISIVNPNNKSVEDIVNTLKEQIKGND